MFAVSYLAQLLLPIDAKKYFCRMGILLKKVHNILLYDAGQFYVKKQDGGRIKICEIFSGNSLKEDLSIDTTFDPC